MAEEPTRRARDRSDRFHRSLRRRLFEIVPVDLLEWQPRRPLREPRTRVDVEIRKVTADTRAEWEALIPAFRRRNLDPFLGRGDTGFLALVDGRYAGWIFLSRVSHRDPWSGFRIRLAPDEAYAYALFVEHEHRPHGLAGALMTAMLTEVRDDPALTRVYGWVDKRNRESQMLLRMLGFTTAQEAQRVKLARAGLLRPGSATPKYGPLSRTGRHSEAG